MNKIYQNFQERYNTAIQRYNEGHLNDYFHYTRLAIEWFGKLVIFEMFPNKNDANKVINGEWYIKRQTLQSGKKLWSLEQTKPSQEPEGSFFISTMAPNSIFLNKTQLQQPTEKSMKRFAKEINNDCKTLEEFYSTASEIEQHTGHTDKNIYVQAKAIVEFFPKVFNDFQRIFSEETIEFLKTLNTIEKEIVNENYNTIVAEQKSNEFVALDSLTQYFSRLTGLDYVAILPKSVDSEVITSGLLNIFFNLPWNLVVDLNPKTKEGIYENSSQEARGSIRIISDDLSELAAGPNLINWIFAGGRTDLEVYDDRKMYRNCPQMFKKTLSKLVRTGQTSDYIIFDFCHDVKLTSRLFDKLEDVFGSWDNVQSRCKIVSFIQNSDEKEKLETWNQDYEINMLCVSATFNEFLSHITELIPTSNSSSDDKLLIKNRTIDVTDAQKRYQAAGIEFYSPIKLKENDRKWDFYSGAEITWEELEKQCDVPREIYHQVHQKILETIKTMRKATFYTLRHRPGSGATTLARRLAYDIRKADEFGSINCTAIDIKNASNPRLTEQYLCQLSERLDNSPILAIIESKRVGKEKFDQLVARIAKAGKKVLFFYIEPFTGRYFTPNNSVTLLDSILKPNEKKRFTDKYVHLGLKTELLEDSNISRNMEVIDFPLMLRDEKTCDALTSYVKEWMDVLPENLQKFCAFVSFIFKYSDLGVNQTLLKNVWKNSEQYNLTSYGIVENAIKKLLIQESTKEGIPTGIWRPRYNRFSSFILNAYKSNWESAISEIAKNLISICKEIGELGSDDMDMLYSVFIIRKNADYRAIEDKGSLKNKFSLLVKDLRDDERAEALLKSLVDAFPNDAKFRGHFARFLYEKATNLTKVDIDDRLFTDAQSHLNTAFELKPNDSDLYHMQGMLIRRRIAVLTRRVKKDLADNNTDIDFDDIENTLVDWTKDAVSAFEHSIALAPSSPYGYATECQLFRESIELGKIIHNESDYRFCESRTIYSEYTEKLGEVLDLLEQVCYAFKADGLSQIVNSYGIYETIRAYHLNIIGNARESISRYRGLYNTAKDENKMLYGNLLVKSIIYSHMSSKDTKKAYRTLSQQESKEIESILHYQKNKGDIRSYETLFYLKLYGQEEFSLDETIDLLKEWEAQFTDANRVGWGYLNAVFYLAVCYSSKAIIANNVNYELSSLAMSYFKKAEEFAKKFDKGTVSPQCYLGERVDIHCIVDKQRKDLDAAVITGVINNINTRNNKGIMKMKCGLDVTFNAKGFDILHDEGQSLRGVLGFSYNGPGLYDFRPEDYQDETESTYENLKQEYVPSEDLEEDAEKELTTSEYDIDANINQTKEPKIKIKQVGFLDNIAQYQRDGKKKKAVPDIPEENHSYIGNINSEKTRIYCKQLSLNIIIDKNGGFRSGFTLKECDYNAEELVKFKLRKQFNSKKNKDFFFAIDVHPENE